MRESGSSGEMCTIVLLLLSGFVSTPYHKIRNMSTPLGTPFLLFFIYGYLNVYSHNAYESFSLNLTKFILKIYAKRRVAVQGVGSGKKG